MTLRRILSLSATPALLFFGIETASAEFEFSDEIRTRQELILVAKGEAPADLILQGVTLLDVHTGTWKEAWDIVIKGERIAWTGPTGAWTGTVAKRVDESGCYAVPG